MFRSLFLRDLFLQVFRHANWWNTWLAMQTGETALGRETSGAGFAITTGETGGRLHGCRFRWRNGWCGFHLTYNSFIYFHLSYIKNHKVSFFFSMYFLLKIILFQSNHFNLNSLFKLSWNNSVTWQLFQVWSVDRVNIFL